MSDKDRNSVLEPFKIQIECHSEELNEAQIRSKEKATKEYTEFYNKFEQYTADKRDLKIEKGDLCTFIEFVSSNASRTTPKNGVGLVSAQKTTASTNSDSSANLLNNQRVTFTIPASPVNSIQPARSVSSFHSPISIVNFGGTNVAVTGNATPNNPVVFSTPDSVPTSCVTSPHQPISIINVGGANVAVTSVPNNLIPAKVNVSSVIYPPRKTAPASLQHATITSNPSSVNIVNAIGTSAAATTTSPRPVLNPTVYSTVRPPPPSYSASISSAGSNNNNAVNSPKSSNTPTHPAPNPPIKPTINSSPTVTVNPTPHPVTPAAKSIPPHKVAGSVVGKVVVQNKSSGSSIIVSRSREPTSSKSSSSTRPESADRPTNVSVTDAEAPSSARKTPSPALCIDLTEDRTSSDDGKTHPTLAVFAKPSVRSESEGKSPEILKEKASLDAQMRKVLLFSAQNFTEWLMQTGLLKCKQFCPVHKGDFGNDKKLKLGQLTVANGYTGRSGGYVWLSECCPQNHVSVFTGSIFEGSGYPPATTLKLIYHWACQTAIVNIQQWITVSAVYIKNLYALLRAVCVAAVAEHYGLMGGPDKKLQIGVVSIGSSSNQSNTAKKFCVLDILCVFDPETKVVRLRAVEMERTSMKFSKLFGILPDWIANGTTLLVDNTIDKSQMSKMMSGKVNDTKVKDKNGVEQYPNFQAMDYLRLIIPKLFQNTLSDLTRQEMQQFLDELCWRERWGPFPARAFDTIIKHLIEQTKMDCTSTLVNCLVNIGADPFKDWKYSKWKSNINYYDSHKLVPSNRAAKSRLSSTEDKDKSGGPTKKTKYQSQTAKTTPLSSSSDVEQTKSTDGDSTGSIRGKNLLSEENAAANVPTILLEPYYYGTIPGDKKLMTKHRDFSVSCVMCRKQFRNNLELTEHLVHHAVSPPGGKEQRWLCKYCCEVFPSQRLFQQHQSSSHRGAPYIPSPSSNSVYCLTCNLVLRTVKYLILHMNKHHGELELPYWCKVCDFRTSIFMLMIQHINRCHGEDDTAFCPYCFRCFRYYGRGGRPCYNTQFKFVSHVQRHQLPLAKKCSRCMTSCVDKSSLRRHVIECHRSLRGDDARVRRYALTSTPMPVPPENPPLPAVDKCRQLSGVESYKAFPFSDDFSVSVDDGAVCIECDAPIYDRHFVADMLCLKCDYSTCCSTSMNEHSLVYHQTGFAMIKNLPTRSDTNLNCSCSFTTNDGNQMADHLVKCRKTTCYGEPKNIAIADIKSLIGSRQSDSDDDSSGTLTPSVVDKLNTTYLIQPSTSVNNATFIIDR